MVLAFVNNSQNLSELDTTYTWVEAGNSRSGISIYACDQSAIKPPKATPSVPKWPKCFAKRRPTSQPLTGIDGCSKGSNLGCWNVATKDEGPAQCSAAQHSAGWCPLFQIMSPVTSMGHVLAPVAYFRVTAEMPSPVTSTFTPIP